MQPAIPNATPKVHPASREILPDDPLEMTGCEVPGDPDLMLRMLIEEYARIGWGVEAIMQLARDPQLPGISRIAAHVGRRRPAATSQRDRVALRRHASPSSRNRHRCRTGWYHWRYRGLEPPPRRHPCQRFTTGKSAAT